ncbi:Zinc finger protein 26 [Folsomia candida]|uniref:Zinc finger protein 26 n=1 Tax=Folsomia candida TaxID=158441 RepID=A0A226DS28_FOLCA|nr:Zinc finger protein 26 [Folsomia candida]
MASTQENVWNCATCSKTFKTKRNLTNHILTHDPETKVKCQVCGKVSTNSRTLSIHALMYHTNRKGPSCNICQRVCSTPSNLRKHIATVHSTIERPRFPCRCGKTYSSKNGLLKHIKTEHSESPARFPCTLCGKEFKTRCSLEEHISTHTTEKAYICSTCGRGFGHSSAMRRHEAIHLEKSTRRNFKCELCPLTFVLRYNLQSHVQAVHENQRNHHCTFCDKRFSTSGSMRRHVERRHSAKIHTCHKCEFRSRSKRSLAQHARCHNPPNRRECYFCQKQFFHFVEMVSHFRRHTLERRQSRKFALRFRMEPPPGSGWRCSKCLKTFNTKANLRYHMFSHDTFAKAKCEICGKVLKNPLVLSQHIKRHHTKRDRPSCNICHRVFATPQNLRAHISTVHNRTKRPRFPCEFPGCGKTYLNKEGVSTHIKAEHSENPIRFPCTLCGKEFEAKRDLELHINTHTTEKAYICPNCGRGFAHRTSLKNHEATHLAKSTRRIFKCDLCPHKSLSRPDLLSHVQIVHENRRNYLCTFCDKRFSTSGNMKLHVEARHTPNKEKIYSFEKNKVHLLRRPGSVVLKLRSSMASRQASDWKCPICSKTFKAKRNLRYHILTHNPEAKVKCQVQTPPIGPENIKMWFPLIFEKGCGQEGGFCGISKKSQIAPETTPTLS